MSVASLSGILEGGAHVAPPRANEPIFDSVRIRVNAYYYKFMLHYKVPTVLTGVSFFLTKYAPMAIHE